MNYNKAIIAGNLVRDPELKFTPSGAAICNFTVAINRKWRTDAGEEREEVAFIGCTAFGKTAESIAKHVRKGSCVHVEGRLKQDNWEDKKTGEKKSKTYVGVDTWQFAGGKSDAAQKPAANSPGKPDSSAEPGEEDDVPF